MTDSTFQSIIDLLKASAFENISLISSTKPTSQPLIVFDPDPQLKSVAPLNIFDIPLTTFSGVQPLISLSKDVAPSNMLVISVTFVTFQDPIRSLEPPLSKAVAPLNILFMSVTLIVTQAPLLVPIALLKDVAPSNILLASSSESISQRLISPLKSLAPENISLIVVTILVSHNPVPLE